MKNPLRFFQEVKQEAFRVTWPTKKETMQGALMVFALASIAAIFSFIRSNFTFFIEFHFNYKFLIYELVYSTSIFWIRKKKKSC